MKLRITLLLAIAALTLSDTLVFAQPRSNDGQPQEEMREGGRRRERRDGRRRGPNMDQMYDRLTKEIALDEEQLAQLEEIKAAQRERFESFRQRREEIRELEQSGDAEGAQRLRDEMRSEFEQNAGRRGGPMAETVEAIEGILNDDQLQQFRTLQETVRKERDQQMRQRFNERYDEFANQLGLDDDQRVVLEDIKAQQVEQMESFRARWEEVRQAYDDGDTEYADSLRQELVSEMRDGGGPRRFFNDAMEQLDPVLTDEQREIAVQMQEDRESRRDRRRERRQEMAEGQSDSATTEVNQRSGEVVADDNGNVPSIDKAPIGSVDSLPGVLNLDDDQKSVYSELSNAHQASMNATNMKAESLRQKLAKAEADGDEAMVETLTAQLAEVEANAAAEDEQFYNRLNEILDDDQRALLSDFRTEQQVEKDLEGIDADLRTVLRAAMRLKLDREQKEFVRNMAKESRERVKAARKTDRKNRDRERTAEKKLAEQIRDEIAAKLTADQSVEFTKSLEKMSRKTRSRR